MKTNRYDIYQVIGKASSFLIEVLPSLIKILTKIFIVYIPILIFWAMLINVDFNGALFVSEFQKMNIEDLHKIYFITASFVALFYVLHGTVLFLTDKSTKKAS